jgi:glucose-6-phosphate dehydrogenase assembly protein OpcA
VNERLDIFPGGEPMQADPDAIGRELRARWRATAAAEGGAVMRAVQLNFVVHASADADPAAIARTVGRVASVLPCRAFVLLASGAPADAPPIQAWIASHCAASGSHKQVCCEQITLRARADAADALGAELLALLVPDVPTVVYWPAGDVGSPVLDRIARSADRLVVDSTTFAPVGAGLAATAARAASGALVVDDIAWSRLDAWRELTAAPFDAPPFDRLLATVRAVHIVHARDGEAAAWLYAGWLASRLAWRPERRHRDRLVLQSASGPVQLRLEVEPDGKATGTEVLRRVRLAAGDSTAFVLGVDPRYPALVAARVERPAACPLPQHRETQVLDRDDELVGVLQRRRPNPAFAAALAAAAELCGMRA